MSSIAIAGSGGGITPGTTTITGGTDKTVLFDKAGVVGEDADFTFDYTNKAVAITSVANPSVSTLALTGATALTTSQPILSKTQTWNNAAVTFNGEVVNVTDTNSATLSRLMSWQVGGNELAGVVKDGSMFANLGLWKSASQSFNGSNFYGISFGINMDFYLGGTLAASFSTSPNQIILHGTSTTQTKIRNSVQVTNDFDTGFSRIAPGVMGFGNGNAGDVTGFIQWAGENRVSSQFDKTADTTLATITGLSVSLSAGRTYSFRAYLHVSPDAVGGHKYAIGTPDTLTATSIIYQINSINNTTNANIINSRQTALGGSVGVVSGTVDYTEIIGTITVNAAGTLAVQFAQNAASGTSSVLVGSFMIVQDMP